ncbi:MAG: hypothetical protein JWO58_581 [Chitinophagaceae bacterium]|nr:hypothetical protein [Chitinophagaceae bacterium]
MRIIFIVLLILSARTIFSQVNDSTLIVQKKRVDTIVIYEEPILVKKTIYIKKQKKIREKESDFYLSVLTTFSTDKDYYNVCPNGDCQDYFNSIKKTTRPYINTSYELTLGYAPSRMYTELGFSYSIYRDKFNYTDSSGITYNDVNRYKYGDLSLSSGYWFNKKHPLSFILLGGLSISKLLSATGSTLSKKNVDCVVILTDQVHLYDYNYRALARFKALYSLSKYLFAQVGVMYAYDIRSIIKTSDLYVRQRNIFGISIGLTYRF